MWNQWTFGECKHGSTLLLTPTGDPKIFKIIMLLIIWITISYTDHLESWIKNQLPFRVEEAACILAASASYPSKSIIQFPQKVSVSK